MHQKPPKPARQWRSRAAVSVAIAIVVTLTVSLVVARAAVSETSTSAKVTIYVDSTTGNDGNSGTSQSAPLKNISVAGQREAGRILVRRGSVYLGPLVISGSGTAADRLDVGTYGSGDLPTIYQGDPGDCLVLQGDYITLDSFNVEGCNQNGVRIVGTDDTVKNSVITQNGVGITVNAGADRCQLLSNKLIDNNKMIVNTPGGTDDFGAMGIAIDAADSCVIAKNYISGSYANSYDYGQDGSAIEIFGSTNTTVYQNEARENLAFSELGNDGTSGNQFYYNVVSSSLAHAAFITVHGGDGLYGGVADTQVTNNTVVLTGGSGTGFYCDACSPAVLEATNNLVVASRLVGFAGSWVNKHNLLATSSVFVNMSAGDYHLATDSPALNSGVPTCHSTDFDGLPVGRQPSIGAFQS